MKTANTTTKKTTVKNSPIVASNKTKSNQEKAYEKALKNHAQAPLVPVLSCRYVARKNNAPRATYEFTVKDYGEYLADGKTKRKDIDRYEYVDDGLKYSKRSNRRFVVYVPANIRASFPDMPEFAAQYIIACSYKMVGTALLTDYQKSGLPFVYDMLRQVWQQGTEKFGQAMFQEIATEIELHTRMKDRHTGRMVEVMPYMTQKIIFDRAKENDFVYGYDDTKVICENFTFCDVDDLLSVAQLRMMALIRAGQIKSFSDVWLQSDCIYSAINRYIKSIRSKTAEMQDNVRIFDENGYERVLKAAYFDQHNAIDIESILTALKTVLESAQASGYISKRFNVCRAVEMKHLSALGYTQRAICSYMNCDRKQFSDSMTVVQRVIDSPTFYKALSEMI